MNIAHNGSSEKLGGIPNSLIISNPNIMMGKPVIAGTRITIEHILEELAAGTTVDELLDARPRLTPEAIRTALAH